MTEAQITQQMKNNGRHSETVHLDSDAGALDHSNGGQEGADTIGDLTNGWVIKREIARGGMGIVYLAFDPALNRHLAIKRLAARGLELGGALRARFLREARAMAALNHIHICHIYGIGDDAAGPFIAMEYVAGPDPAPNPREPASPFSLESMVHRHGAFSQEQTVSLLGKVAGAVSHAHRHGVIHRDLKPGNVLIDQNGEPRVVDFGLAGLMHDVDERLTITGDKLLSLGYGAPEQEEDAARVDHRADVYALGGLVYFCLTGESPRFYRDHRVSPALRTPLLKALEKDRDLRWSSVDEFMAALNDAITAESIPVPGRDGWVCKWCHALNELSERCCADCGWDGLVQCPQCEHPLRFGIRHCPVCNADLRAFEDAGGLLDLLRDLRRQKAFERVIEQARTVESLRARGAVSEPVYRQILELRQGAVWALQRKEELRQAIAENSTAEDYERVRELLNEYDVIDNGDTYGDLRARLPEKIAERHIGKLYQRLVTARMFMDQKKLDSCRAMMTALRDQQNWITSMAESVPSLQMLDSSGGPPPPDAAPPEDLPGLLVYCSQAIDQLDHEVSAEEERIAAWQSEAESAFQHQDYDHCVRLCREVELLTVEPTPSADLMIRATDALQNIDRLMKEADQALTARRWQQAGNAADRILTNWKANHAGALHVRNSLKRRKRVHRLQLTIITVFLISLTYMAVAAPLMRLAAFTRPDHPATRMLQPAARLYKLPPFRQYARFWGIGKE